MTEQNYLEAFAYNLDYIMQDEGINQSELAKRSNIGNICYALGCEFEDIIPLTSSLVEI